MDLCTFSNFKTGRITNFKNWAPTINKNKKETILCLEYWANDNSDLWSESDENLINLAISEITETKLVEKILLKTDLLLNYLNVTLCIRLVIKINLNQLKNS